MGGKVIEYEAQRIYREGEAKGVAIGEARGEARGEAKGVAIGEARGENKGVDLAMDLVSQLIKSGNYEELARMAEDREYSRQRIQKFKEG